MTASPASGSRSWARFKIRAAACLFTAIALGCDLGLSAARAQTNDLALAGLYPPDQLRVILLPRAQWHPFPVFAERAAWGGLPAEVQTRLLELGQEARAMPLPDLPASLYLEYARDGNRSRFEAQHKARRQRLHQLVLAECVEGKGHFLEAIGDTAWAICEESTWCYPAHISVQRAGGGLPDVQEPIVDLFAAETGVTLSWTLYLLGEKLDQFSPRLRPRLEWEIHRRILTPVLERDNFGWMGFYHVTRTHRPNNWNPWINASVLTAALIVEPDPDRRVQLVHKVLRSLDRFLLCYPADGSCDEGPGYWGHAGGSLFDNLELLHSATGGKLDVFNRPLIREIGRFLYRAHICGDWFVPVGDCSARLHLYQDLVFRYGMRIEDHPLMDLATAGATVETVLESAGDRYFGRLLPAVFDAQAILARRPAAAPLVRDVWLESEDMQLMAARDQAGTCQGFYVAAWGAHNGQSHNHNDVGNYLVFVDGQPVLVDVGVTAYTAKTFSSRRYEIWVMQSGYHNLPVVNGQMQRPGSGAAARQVRYEATDTFAQLEMEIGQAYPGPACIESWVRQVRLNRGRSVEITDTFELREAADPSAQHFLTPCEVLDRSDRGELILGPAPGAAGSSAVLSYDPAQFTVVVERIDLDDDRLQPVWGSHLNRIMLRARSMPLRGQWTFRISQAAP